jgi:NosR/NirI family transcriptional regulator, nitrous oxide reductase regulator
MASFTADSRRSPAQRARVARERRVALIAVLILIVAWIIGRQLAAASVAPFLPQALPGAARFNPVSNNVYAGYETGNPTPIGWVAVGEASGYGGPMQVAVGVNTEGVVTGIAVVDDKETPAWLSMVASSGFLRKLLGKSSAAKLTLGQDIDVISGATYTSRAIVEAVRQASRRAATAGAGLPAPPEEPAPVLFGIPEITLLALFGIGFIGQQRNVRFKKQLRWASLITGLVVLGFLFDRPLTLGNINSLIMGFWPDWHVNLYWYLLIGGILFVYTVDNKNPYCEWFCPFGAAQECLGTMGGVNLRASPRLYQPLKWLQRGLAFTAILLALLLASPGVTSYEIFGTLFRLTGSIWQFMLLFVVLFGSLVIRRPWCSFLCPLAPVTDFIRLVRNWGIETWQSIRHR